MQAPCVVVKERLGRASGAEPGQPTSMPAHVEILPIIRYEYMGYCGDKIRNPREYYLPIAVTVVTVLPRLARPMRRRLEYCIMWAMGLNEWDSISDAR